MPLELRSEPHVIRDQIAGEHGRSVLVEDRALHRFDGSSRWGNMPEQYRLADSSSGPIWTCCECQGLRTNDEPRQEQVQTQPSRPLLGFKSLARGSERV